MSNKKIKPKTCKGCGNEFMPRASIQTACSIKCAFDLVQNKKEKAAATAAKAERKADKEKLEKLKSRRTHLNDAQAIFNKFIRLRDHDQPCISCGAIEATWDAGHYRSVGAAPQLRYNEDNCHRQCVHCNQHKSGNAIEMRRGMIKRIGVERVEALEDSNTLTRWTIEDALRIKTEYKEKIKALETQRKQTLIN